jgi:hypothetical protein
VVLHDLERGVHVAATDLIVVQKLNGERRARSWRKVRREGAGLRRVQLPTVLAVRNDSQVK